MARYSEEAKEQVRDAVDFVDLVGSRTPLSAAGPGRLEGLCVFHEERTPSLSVDPVQKLYHCFGCEAGGDVFQFVQETEGLDFRGAIEFLADRYGVPLGEQSAEDPAAAAARRKSEREHELLDRTAAFYERHLWQSAAGAPAREYLASRGLQEEALRAFRVGFAPDGFDVVLKASKAAGYSASECEAVGLAQPARNGRRIDRFRGRIMFPLADRRGRVVGFGARALGAEQQPKYLNTSETRLFSKGRNLYGAHLARAAAQKTGSTVLSEGYTDVIALHQAGAQNTVGSLGTAVTEHQVAELARLAPTVQFALDADAPGREAVLRAGELAAARGLHARVIALPAGRDPADVAVGPDGPRAVVTLIGASVPMVSFRVEHELAREPLTTAEAKDRAIDALRPVFAELPSSALREELLQSVATATQIPVAKVADWLHPHDAAPSPTQDAPAAAAGAPALDPEIEQARAVTRANQARPPREAAAPAPSPLPGPAADAHSSLPGLQARVGEWER